MDYQFLCKFVEVVADRAARGFQSVHVDSIRFKWSHFEVLVTINGRYHALQLDLDRVRDTVENNALVLRLEEQLLWQGAVERNEE